MSVSVLPDYGARVVSLVDKASGRDWIFGGGQSPNVGEDTVYGGDEAVGWDECFPTVAPFDAADTVWKRRLRDHGDLWGRPWSVESRTDTSLSAAFQSPQFRFGRTLEVAGRTMRASYTLENRTSEDMPFLWALHALLAVTPRDRIVLPDVAEVEGNYLSLAGTPLKRASVPWPDAAGALGFPLDEVQPASRRFAGKFYAAGMASRRVSVGHGDEWLTIKWDEAIDDLGIWLNYGAWPSAPGTHHIALEPTTGSADHLGQALVSGNPTIVAPGATAAWTITLILAKEAQRLTPAKNRISLAPSETASRT